MHIVNAMFSRGKGGIEQAFLDYCRALAFLGNQVTAVIHPQAAICEALYEIPGIRIQTISNHGQWDVLAVLRLRLLLRALSPDAVIVHGNRAATLLRKAARGMCPVVGVTHNYSLGRLLKLNALFALTGDLKHHALKADFPATKIYEVPNMLSGVILSVSEESPAAGDTPPLAQDDTPVIGAMGRFVKKKGFDDWLRALAELQSRNIAFKAVLGGSGEEETNLKQLAEELHLTNKVHFSGWVEDKTSFFASVDIFCLPSLHEPFGIVLLEAMASGIPAITTATEGPSEIATDRINALLVPKNNPAAMADALATLLRDKPLANQLAQGGIETIRARYTMEKVSATIQESLVEIVKHHG